MASAPLPRPEPQRRNGFAPIDNQYLWDWSRLVSGNAQIFSILLINSEIHTLRKKGDPPLKWTRVITHEELAQFCRCTIRAIEMATGDLVDRHVIERKKTGKGHVYRIPFDSWPELPDQPSKVIALEEVAQPADEETEEEKAAGKGATFPLVPTWKKVSSKGRTKPVVFPDKVIPDRLRIRTEDGIEYRSFIVGNTLDVEIRSEQGTSTKGEEKRKSLRVDSTQVQSHQQNDFELVAKQHGWKAAPGDWKEARSTWNLLGPEDQAAAVQGVHDRFEQGEFDDPRYIPLPQNYLSRETWKRAVRPRKAVKKAGVFRDEAGAREFIDHLRKIGGKK